MKTVLFVAFHFPPNSAGSGMLRILKFCRFLPALGWKPVVLTISPRAYERTDSALLAQVPDSVTVIRAFGLDTQKHLSIRRRYFRWTALPDRWISWCLAAIVRGLARIRRDRADLILSTYPIATAVFIGFVLHKLTGTPWVVDFRDSMTEDEYPADPTTRRIYRWIEKKAVQHAARLIFTSPSTIRMYTKRYPELDAAKCVLIRNGYDEEDFSWLTPAQPTAVPTGSAIRLLHLGLIYPWERDPRPFFRAISRLKKQGQLSAAYLQVNLRASGNESDYAQILRELEIEDLIHLLPPLPYQQALREAAESEALLLFQAANCDHQIPAKAYEYLRLGRPVLALTSANGDTAALLNETGGATIIDIADEDAIVHALPAFLTAVRAGHHPVADLNRVQAFARKNQARALAQTLSAIERTEKGTLQSEPDLATRPTVPSSRR